MADQIVAYLDQLDKLLAKFPAVVQFEKKTKVPKAYAATSAFLVFGLFIFFNVGASLLTNILGFVYPAYASFKAIESSNKADDTQWLTYWCVFGFLNLLEYFSDFLLYWVPLYYTFKALLILYLYLPQFNGAHQLYVQVLRPHLIPQEKVIDETIERVKKNVEKIGEQLNDKKSD